MDSQDLDPDDLDMATPGQEGVCQSDLFPCRSRLPIALLTPAPGLGFSPAMSDHRQHSRPNRKGEAEASRLVKEAEALRANLHKRKAQIRARQRPPAADGASDAKAGVEPQG